MTVREWIAYNLTHNPELIILFENLGLDLKDQVSQGETMTSRIRSTPYLFYTLGFQTDLNLSETVRPSRHYFQIYVHDRPAYYGNINGILSAISNLSLWTPHKEVFGFEWMENSRDLDDDTLGTIMRYARFTFRKGTSNAS